MDMVVGSRFLRASHITYNYPIVNRIGVRVLSLLISLGAKKIFTDSHGGFRAMRRELCAGFSFLGTHSYVQETIIDAIARGYRVIEIPSRWNRRQKGESRVVRSPFGYAKKMLIPLVLRSHLHRYIVVFLTIACSGLQWFRLLWFLSVWLVLEGYQLWKFRLNQRLLEVHSDAKL